MNKVKIITIVFVLSLIININSADAALFSWRTLFTNSPKLNASISTDWSFASIANKSADTKSNLAEAIQAPEEKNMQIVKTYLVRATAYSSTVDQTDDSPFITASNTYVRDGIVAANFLPFKTKIMIPELFGNKVFTVEDRMHRRFSDRVDIWFD